MTENDGGTVIPISSRIHDTEARQAYEQQEQERRLLRRIADLGIEHAIIVDYLQKLANHEIETVSSAANNLLADLHELDGARLRDREI